MNVSCGGEEAAPSARYARSAHVRSQDVRKLPREFSDVRAWSNLGAIRLGNRDESAPQADLEWISP
jgi:hypothetical protein